MAILKADMRVFSYKSVTHDIVELHMVRKCKYAPFYVVQPTIKCFAVQKQVNLGCRVKFSLSGVHCAVPNSHIYTHIYKHVYTCIHTNVNLRTPHATRTSSHYTHAPRIHTFAHVRIFGRGPTHIPRARHFSFMKANY